MSMFNKINLNEGKKYDASEVSMDGMSKEEIEAAVKKNNKLIDIYKALGSGDGMSSIDLAKAMDGFSKMDTSGDGKLSNKELEAGAEKFNKEHGTNIKGKDLKAFIKSLRKATKDDTKVETNKVLEKEAARVKLQEDVDVAIKSFLGDLDQKAKAREAAEAKAEADAKAAAEAEAKAKAEDLRTFKPYTVQENERLESILQRTLKAQGLEVNEKNMADAKAEFVKNNPNALHGPKNNQYLYGGAVIKVAGNLEDKKNGSEINAKFQKIQDDKKAQSEADAKAKAEAEAKEKARQEAGAVPYPAKEKEQPALPGFEPPSFVPKENKPTVQVPLAPPEDNSPKKTPEEKAAAEKAARLNKALDTLSPSSRPNNEGQLPFNNKIEKMTKENKELLDEIAKADNPSFAARALLAASKGVGTNDVLFEAVLNAGKDKNYYQQIDKELKKRGESLYHLVNTEYLASSPSSVSDNKFFKSFISDNYRTK